MQCIGRTAPPDYRSLGEGIEVLAAAITGDRQHRIRRLVAVSLGDLERPAVLGPTNSPRRPNDRDDSCLAFLEWYIIPRGRSPPAVVARSQQPATDLRSLERPRNQIHI